VGEIINQRESKIEDETNKIESLTLEIEEKTKFIENSLNEAKRESARKKEELIKEGEKVREEILITARENSKNLFESKMKELDDKILNAQEKLESEIKGFSNKIKQVFF
jgi:F0F1-type ATP synthase membrane subunit b/b'